VISIDLKKDFSPSPFGMYITDGKNSGERFRKDFLLKHLNESDDYISINIATKYSGLGSSFLIGAFSLIMDEVNIKTEKRYTYDEVKSRVTFISNNNETKDIDDVWKWMKELEISIPKNENSNRINDINEKARKMLKY
jgi:hypothetical protein